MTQARKAGPLPFAVQPDNALHSTRRKEWAKWPQLCPYPWTLSMECPCPKTKEVLVRPLALWETHKKRPLQLPWKGILSVTPLSQKTRDRTMSKLLLREDYTRALRSLQSQGHQKRRQKRSSIRRSTRCLLLCRVRPFAIASKEFSMLFKARRTSHRWRDSARMMLELGQGAYSDLVPNKKVLLFRRLMTPHH